MPRIRGLAVLGVALATLALPHTTHAAPIDLGTLSGSVLFGGEFVNDNDFAEFLFTVVEPSTFHVETTSYAGNDGFDPMLHLFDSQGSIVLVPQSDGTFLEASNDDAVPFPPENEPIVRDSVIDIASLGAGTYTLVVTQYFNYPNFPFNTGFAYDSSDALDLTRYTSCPSGNLNTEQEPNLCPAFVDSEGVPRNGTFGGSLTITPTDQPAPVPEPGTLALLSTGIGWLASRRRLRRKAGAQVRDS
jgi:hypothetical protein